MRLSSLFIISTLFAFSLAQSLSVLNEDTSSIITRIFSLRDALNIVTPSSTPIQANNVHTRSVALSDYLSIAADHALATPPLTESEAQNLLLTIQAFQPTFSATVGSFSFKKWALDPLGVSPIVKQDLVPLRANTLRYTTGLVNIAPPSLAPSFITFRNQMETALANAQAAFP